MEGDFLGYIEEIRALVGHRPLILVGSVVLIVNEDGHILLQHRKYPKGSWGIPGGLMELEESTEDTARREVFEETKLEIGELKLINIYSGPQNYIKAANGDEFYVVTAAYYTQQIKGDMVVDTTEAITFEYFHPKHIPDAVVMSHQQIIKDFMNNHYQSIIRKEGKSKGC